MAGRAPGGSSSNQQVVLASSNTPTLGAGKSSSTAPTPTVGPAPANQPVFGPGPSPAPTNQPVFGPGPSPAPAGQPVFGPGPSPAPAAPSGFGRAITAVPRSRATARTTPAVGFGPGEDINKFALQALQDAASAARREASYTPATVSAPRVSASTIKPVSPIAADIIQEAEPIVAQVIEPELLRETDLSPYMNPFIGSVIEELMADLERQRQIQQTSIGAQATAARAFGGSRQGVTEALTNEAFARQLAQSAAGLRQAGFQQAQAAAQEDVATIMQADLANQAANLQAQTTTGAQQLQVRTANQAAQEAAARANQQAALQVATANQAAQEAAARANQQAALQAATQNQAARLAASQQRLTAGSQLSNLSNLGFGMGQTITQNLAQQGAQQQALQQALIDAARGQFGGYSGAPASSVQLLTGALGATPTPQTQTTSSSPGLFDYLTLGAAGLAAFPFGGPAVTIGASDVRLKEKVKHVGNLTPEIGLYEWEWNDEAKRIGVGDQPTVGVIAQEVKDKIPGAVLLDSNGYFRVDYDKIAEAVR